MIELVEGRGVGSGKSYYACSKILAHLSVGGIVYCASTFGFKFDEAKALIERRNGVEILPQQYNTFPMEEAWRLHELTPRGTAELPVLIVFDEAHMVLNARDFADKKKRPFFDWLTQSRHDDCDIIFISQCAFNVDAQVRRLVTYIVRARNMANFEIPWVGKWPFKQFAYSRMDADGRTLMRRDWAKQDPEIFNCYESKSCRGSHKRLDLVAAPLSLKKVKPKKNPMKILIIAIVLGLAIGGYALINRPSAPAPSVVTKQEPEKTPVQRQAMATPPMPAYDIYAEKFVAYYGLGRRSVVRTANSEYQLGEMSDKGLVTALTDRRVKILQPNGRTGWVVAYDPPPIAQLKERIDAASQTTPTASPGASAATLAQPSIPPPFPGCCGDTPILENTPQLVAGASSQKTGTR